MIHLNLTHFLHNIEENLLPTSLIGGGISLGYTHLFDSPLSYILPNPAELTEVKDVFTIISIGIGTIIMVVNFIIKLSSKKTDKKNAELLKEDDELPKKNIRD